MNKCDWCGKDFEEKNKPKGGRPSFYCSPECGQTKRWWDAVRRGIDKTDFTIDARKAIRREFMQVVNQSFHDNRKRTKTTGANK